MTSKPLTDEFSLSTISVSTRVIFFFLKIIKCNKLPAPCVLIEQLSITNTRGYQSMGLESSMSYRDPIYFLRASVITSNAWRLQTRLLGSSVICLLNDIRLGQLISCDGNASDCFIMWMYIYIYIYIYITEMAVLVVLLFILIFELIST